MKLFTRFRHGLGLALGLAFIAVNPAHAQSVVFAGYGGAYQDNVAKALLRPAAAKVGATLRQESHDNLSSVRVQVQSGKPGWDLVQLGSESCEAGTREGLFEKLDYRQIDANGIPAQMRADTWVGSSYFSVVMAWRTDKYKGNPPRSWADFWDTTKFPGRRALSTYPQESMEIALLADGVAPDKLYPLDLQRAIRSLERIKPSVAVWYKSGAQSAQLLKDGEVDMIAIWGSRIAPLVKEGERVAYTFHQGLLNAACFAIPRGAKQAATAQKMIAAMVTPEIQANIPEFLELYGPVNTKAFEVRSYTPSELVKINSSPQNRREQILMDPRFWGANLPKATEMYRQLMAP